MSMSKNPTKITMNDVDAFISDVLKIGHRDNIFDTYLDERGIPKHELTAFITMVVDRINSKWLLR